MTAESDLGLAGVRKRCPACGVVKSLSDFHRNRSRGDGHSDICKPCAIARVKANAARRRAAMGEEAWLAQARDRMRQSRARTGNASGKLYDRAKRRAVRSLIEAHQAEYDTLLRRALDDLRQADQPGPTVSDLLQ